MLRDYSHYLFRFHDQFVEAIAAGVWFEESESRFDRAVMSPGHPLVDLDEANTQETFTVEGYRCHVRVNPKPMDQLVADSRFCSQPLYQFALELDGTAPVDWSATVRSCAGPTKTVLTRKFGGTQAEFEGVAPLENLRGRLDAWILEVKKRRAEMGKD